LFNTTVGNNTYTMPSRWSAAGNFSQTVNDHRRPDSDLRSHHADAFPGTSFPPTASATRGRHAEPVPLPAPQGLALDPTGNRGYNFRAVPAGVAAAGRQVLRVDYNFSPKVTTYARLLQDYQAQNGYNTTVGLPAAPGASFRTVTT